MTVSEHYDKFEVNLTKKEIKEGKIRLDPYRVAMQWDLGSKDPSGCLFHLLKTIARFGTKKGNTKNREIESLKATIKRMWELYIGHRSLEPTEINITTDIDEEKISEKIRDIFEKEHIRRIPGVPYWEKHGTYPWNTPITTNPHLYDLQPQVMSAEQVFSQDIS